MKIVLAKSAGFCFGVRSAVDRIAKSLRGRRRIQIDGDLIHNPQTISILSRRGLTKVAEIDGSSPAAIRTHGTTAGKLRLVHACAPSVYNLTCPRVSRIQGIIRKHSRAGYYTLLVGDEGHPEVISLRSYAEAGISVIRSAEQLPDLSLFDRILLISQTTIDRALFESVRLAVAVRAPHATVFDTICDSTGNKQSELRDALASGADTVVVIGGKHSANTRSLAEIARDAGAHTLHVESSDEFSDADFAESAFVFVTAGASTPDWAIRDAIARLEEIRIAKISPRLRRAAGILQGAAYLYLYQGASVFAAFYLLSADLSKSALAAASFVMFSLAAEVTAHPFTVFSDRSRSIFYAKPARFIRTGSHAPDFSPPPPTGSGIPSLALRAASALALPASWIVSRGVFGAADAFASLLLFIIAASPHFARELRDADTDLVTGKISISPGRLKGAAVLVSACAVGMLCSFAFTCVSGGKLTPLLVISAVPLADAAASLTRIRGIRTARSAAECARIILAAAAALLK